MLSTFLSVEFCGNCNVISVFTVLDTINSMFQSWCGCTPSSRDWFFVCLFFKKSPGLVFIALTSTLRYLFWFFFSLGIIVHIWVCATGACSTCCIGLHLCSTWCVPDHGQSPIHSQEERRMVSPSYSSSSVSRRTGVFLLKSKQINCCFIRRWHGFV